MKMFQPHKRHIASEKCLGEYGYPSTQLGQGSSNPDLLIYIACNHPINEESVLGTSAQVHFSIFGTRIAEISNVCQLCPILPCRNEVIIGRHTEKTQEREGR